MSLESMAAEAAMVVLKGLLGKWVADGKDPHVEAVKLMSSYEAKADIDAELQAMVDARTGRVPGSSE